MLSEEIIFFLKLILVATYTLGALFIMNPAVSFLEPFPHLKYLLQAFFYRTGFLGFWGVFCKIGEWSKDVKITIKTNHTDEVYYILKDREINPFFKLHTDNSAILQVHHMLKSEHNKIILNNLYHRAKNFYEKNGLELIAFKVEIVGIKNASDKHFMHDIIEPKFNWTETLMNWKIGEQIPVGEEKV